MKQDIENSKVAVEIANQIQDAKARHKSLMRDSQDAHLKAQLQEEHVWNLEKIQAALK